MKVLLIICAVLMFVSIANLPLGFYTLLRIVVTLAAIVIVVTEFNNGFNFWVIIFGLIGVLFNPLIPIYLNDKSSWIAIDIICGIFFLIKSLTIK